MKATIGKSEVKFAVAAIKKLCKPFAVIIDVRDNELNIIVNEDIIYFRYSIPVTDAEEGTVCINFEHLEKLKNLRNETITFSANGKDLSVKCGTTLQIHCNEFSEEKLFEPKMEKVTKVIFPEQFKTLFNLKFKYVIFDEDNIPILIENKKEKFFLSMADSIHSLRYLSNYKLKKDFRLTVNFITIKNIFSLINKEFEFNISSNSFSVITENFKVIIPQLNSVSTIENSLEFYKKSHYKEEKITFNSLDMVNLIKSIGIIGTTEDRIIFNIVKDKIKLTLNSTAGNSEDIIKVKNEYKEKLKFEVPLTIFLELIECVNNEKEPFKEVTFRLANSGKIFILEGNSIKCIGPVIY